MNLSKRAQAMQASPIRKLKPHADKATQAGVHIYPLNIGQPDIETPKVMMDVHHNLDLKVVAYGPSQGLEEYRTGLVKYYRHCGIDLKNEEIIVTTAGSEAIVFAMLSICDDGDEVIVFEPFYTNYNGFATQSGVKLVPVTTTAETGFALPSDEKIMAAIGPRTRAIMICNPGNPTGTVYPLADLQRLAGIAREKGIYLISDEVYREFVYDGAKAHSVLDLPDFAENAIMVDSISKRYSACGSRIGCIASRNKALMGVALKFAQARLCPPTVEQLAALAATSLGDDYFAEMIGEYRKRRDIVFEELNKIEGIVCVKPQGAFYIIVKMPIDDAEKFAVWMLEDFRLNNETVMIAPAEGFYATPGLGRNEARLAYILNEHDLRKAMHIFREGLETYRKLNS